jgi:glutathione S-transferase
MQLLAMLTSPFVRKVRVSAFELDLMDQIELVEITTAPTAPDRHLITSNPAGKVPTLLIDDGRPLYDSRVICEYLDSIADEPRLLAAEADGRLEVLRLHALADELAHAAIAIARENRRPAELQWEEWRAAHASKLEQIYDGLEYEPLLDAPDIDLGRIALACTLAWIDFRKVGADFRVDRPRLAAWFDTAARRPSMLATDYPRP